MVNLVSKRCEKCDKISTFGYIGESARFCSEHKLVNMINVRDRKCERCDKIPYFGYDGESARFCSEHKLVNMINVRDRKCERCDKISYFGYDGGSARFCSEHKLVNMINVRDRKCEKCDKIPCFGYDGGSARFCSEHKLVNMINVRDRKCEKCDKIPYFGYIGESAKFCMKHREDGMVDVKNRICPGYNTECPVRTLLAGSEHKYCVSCDPNDSRRKRFKRYENAFFDYVDDKLDIYQREFRVNFDSSETSKTYARIDGIIKQDDVVVCIEIDEDGHDNYECDEHRMHLVNGELLQKYPGINIAWVRVNPNVEDDDQWSPKAINIRNKRFDNVIETINDILMTKNTELKYIGF
jgi:hypothetical protein